jgi:hypothetical protein
VAVLLYDANRGRRRGAATPPPPPQTPAGSPGLWPPPPLQPVERRQRSRKSVLFAAHLLPLSFHSFPILSCVDLELVWRPWQPAKGSRSSGPVSAGLDLVPTYSTGSGVPPMVVGLLFPLRVRGISTLVPHVGLSCSCPGPAWAGLTWFVQLQLECSHTLVTEGVYTSILQNVFRRAAIGMALQLQFL